MNKFELIHKIPESDNISIHKHFDFDMSDQQPKPPTYAPPRMKNHKRTYGERAASQMHQYSSLTWADLKRCMLEATKDVMGDNNKCTKLAKRLPCKPWYDKECKEAGNRLKKLARKAYI